MPTPNRPRTVSYSGKLVTNNPSESDGRKDWDTCFHFEQEFSSFHGGDWEQTLVRWLRFELSEDRQLDMLMKIEEIAKRKERSLETERKE